MHSKKEMNSIFNMVATATGRIEYIDSMQISIEWITYISKLGTFVFWVLHLISTNIQEKPQTELKMGNSCEFLQRNDWKSLIALTGKVQKILAIILATISHSIEHLEVLHISVIALGFVLMFCLNTWNSEKLLVMICYYCLMLYFLP